MHSSGRRLMLILNFRLVSTFWLISNVRFAVPKRPVFNYQNLLIYTKRNTQHCNTYTLIDNVSYTIPKEVQTIPVQSGMERPLLITVRLNRSILLVHILSPPINCQFSNFRMAALQPDESLTTHSRQNQSFRHSVKN